MNQLDHLETMEFLCNACHIESTTHAVDKTIHIGVDVTGNEFCLVVSSWDGTGRLGKL